MRAADLLTKRALRIGAWTATAALFAACASTVVGPGQTSNSTSGSTGSSGTGGLGGGCGTGPLPCGATSSTGAASTGAASTSGAGGATSACPCGKGPFPCCQAGTLDPCCIVCGGTTDTDGGGGTDGGAPCGVFLGGCPPDQYCSFPDMQCGHNGATGVCTLRPQAPCDDVAQPPQCGCDGNDWGTDCLAFAAGVDLGDRACCAPHDNVFACTVDLGCLLGQSYCQIDSAPGSGLTPSCVFFPPACAGNETCDCLTLPSCPGSCGATCSGSPDAGVTVTCCN